MQIIFDHTDLADPEALAILRRVIGGETVTTIFTPRLDIAQGMAREALAEAIQTSAPVTAYHDELIVPAPTPVDVRDIAPPAPETVEAEVASSDLLDSSGIMWDARIHASTRTKVADGTWKMKRGVEPELVAQVMAELKGTPAPTKVEQFAAQVDPSTLGFGTASPVPTPPAPPAPANVAAVPVPPVPTVLADVGDWPADLLGAHRPGFEFQAFMSYVMGRVNEGIPTPTLLATCKEHDVASFSAVNGRPEVIPALARALSQLNKGA